MSENQFLDNEYKSRINQCFDYIEKNIEKPFGLEELAQVANFSKFHFHRIFHAMVGETPFQFILRIRLERAASFLISNPQENITDIAIRFGFTDISIFSRNFKTYFKKSATQYRKEKNEKSNLSQIESKKEQSENKAIMYFCPSSKTIKWRTNMKLNQSMEVKELPKMNVAYIRHTGPYKGDVGLFERLWNKLFSWAGPRGLVGGPDFKSLVIYHDDPNITQEDKLRMSICITVPTDTKVDGDVGKMEIEGGKYAVARFVLSGDEFQQAWEWVYGEWLPNSGYQPDDRACFEMYTEEPQNGKFPVEICVPVKPL